MSAGCRRRMKSWIAGAVCISILIPSPGGLAVRAAAQAIAGSSAAGRASSRVNPGSLRVSAGPTHLPQGAPGMVSMAGTLGAFAAPSVRREPAVLPASEIAALAAPGPVWAAAQDPAHDPAPDGLPGVVGSLTAVMAGPSEREARTGARQEPIETQSNGARVLFDGENSGGRVLPEAALVAGRASAGPSALRPAQAGPQAPPASIPAPAGARLAKAWNRWGLVGSIGAVALAAMPASLLPIVVISGALVVSVLLHETAHIWALRVYGDPTPQAAGRDSLNPLKHIDPLGTILVPAAALAISQALIGFPILLGWARPVPVDFNKLKDPKRDAAKVAMWGPATNIVLAAAAGLALLALPAAAAGTTVALALSTLWKMNLALALFNLLPIPSLDGGKLLIGALPQRAYARWVHNPNLPAGYQGLFQRIYEGPSNILSRFHVHSLEKVNGITRLVSFAALAAFYAVFFTTLQVPLLFLALPCSYDYWCIREKVRSEAAVKDLMDLMSQWGSVISQIAEDLGAKSEVSAFEAEHAMKNALETLIDRLMVKAEFRNLSEEDKARKLMEAYPEMAAEYLKDKAMTEDDIETILKVLKDSRNGVFYERLGKWLKDHDVFKRWGSPHAREKLKDSLKEAGKERTKAAGGSPEAGPSGPQGGFSLKSVALPLLVIGASAALPALSPAFVGLGLAAGILGTGPQGKIRVMRGRMADNHTRLYVRFSRGVEERQALESLSTRLDGIRHSAAVERGARGGVMVRMDTIDPASSLRVLRALDEAAGIENVAVSAAVEQAYRAAGGRASLAQPASETAGLEPVGSPAEDASPAPNPEPDSEPAAEAPPAPEKPVLAEGRGLLVRFAGGTPLDAIKAYGDRWGLRLIEAEYRGGQDLALFEVTEGITPAWVAGILRDHPADRGLIQDVTPLKEAAVAPEPAPSGEGERPPSGDIGPMPNAPAPAPAPPRRDPLAAFLQFLKNQTLTDGKSKLNDEQVQLLFTYLKPVADRRDAPRPPTVGRIPEIKRSIPILSSPRGMRNSVIYVGEAGVGKTAGIEGIGDLIEDAQHAETLKAAGMVDSEAYLQLKRLSGRWLVYLDIDGLLGSQDPVATFRGIMTLVPLLNDGSPQSGNRVMLVLDEIHKLFMDPAGVKIANLLKGPLRNGTLSLLAGTTEKEYKKYVEPDDAFRRRLELVRFAEPTVEQTIDILRGTKKYLEGLHEASIPDESLVLAAKLSHQFDKSNFNPDKSVKAVDDAGELARPDNLRAALALDIRENWRSLLVAFNAARQLLIDKAIPSALALPVEAYNGIAALAKRAADLYQDIAAVKDGKGTVTPELIRRVIAEKTGIAAGQLTLGEEDANRYVEMEAEIGRRVINQGGILKAIANAIRRNKAGISNPNQPIAKFLMVGPTGVGKTYVAKELARFLFKDPNAFTRIDMSEYQQEHEVARMIGSPPGYIGHGAGGQLTEAIRKRPYSVILFDEIEKAHPKVWDILLQILDDGRLTDGEGRTIDFKNTVILISSNAGMSAVDGEKFANMLAGAATPEEKARAEAEWDREIQLAVKEGITGAFRPEFLNRLDEDPDSKNKWVVLNRLRLQDVGAIAKLQAGEFADLLRERHETELDIEPEVYDFLKFTGFSPMYGARPMKGAIEKHIVDPLAKWILEESVKGSKEVRGGLIRVTLEGGAIRFEAKPKPPKVVERTGLEGAAAALTQRLLDYVESMSKPEDDGGAPAEPTEGLFDSFMRAANSPPTAATAPAPPAAFYGPGAPAPAAGGNWVAAVNAKPNGADAVLRGETKRIVEEARERGWPDDVLSALHVAAGGVGTGWIKHFLRQAKESAEPTGKPVELSARVQADRLSVIIHSPHALSDKEKAWFDQHFTGEPPASFADAQAQADNLNLSGAVIRDHNAWDLYRRLRAIPGARLGYAAGRNAKGGEGTDYWIEFRRGAAEAAGVAGDVSPATPVVSPSAPAKTAAPSQAQELFLKLLEQENLKEHEKDGPGVKVAAATAYSWMSTASDLPRARRWMYEGGWAVKGRSSSEVADSWPRAMAATLILERFGSADDIAPVEILAQKISGHTSHVYVPLHGAVANALESLYARAGAGAARAALQGSSNSDVKAAARRALGRIGAREDEERVRDDADATVAILTRQDPEGLEEFYRDHWPPQPNQDGSFADAAWKSYPKEKQQTILRLVARDTRRPEKNLEVLKALLNGKISSERETRYLAAEAWARIVARENMSGDIHGRLQAYLEKNSLTHYGGTDSWAALLALIYALQKTGGPESLPVLKSFMETSPTDIQAAHEQAFFEAPMAWAMTVVRNHLFGTLSAPRQGPSGTQLSVIQEMLTSKNPMFATAAIYAVALAQRASGEASAAASDKPIQPAPDPALPGNGSGSDSSSSGMSSLGQARAEMYERRFFGHGGSWDRWHGHLP